MSISENDTVWEQVKTGYTDVTESSSGCCGGGCCSSNPLESGKTCCSKQGVDAVHEGSNKGLGYSSSHAMTSLKEGEIVVDIECGSGTESFLAARQVGDSGKVIGIDITPAMVSKARKNAEIGNYNNVEFRLGEIGNLPVEENYADVIISKCLINLAPDKQRAFHEAYRILRKGGRLAVSDVVGMGVLPGDLKNNEDYFESISGAGIKEELCNTLKSAGFVDITVELKIESKESIQSWVPQSGVEAYICTAIITACK